VESDHGHEELVNGPDYLEKVLDTIDGGFARGSSPSQRGGRGSTTNQNIESGSNGMGFVCGTDFAGLHSQEFMGGNGLGSWGTQIDPITKDISQL
jgi:hypothetical protein